jgi:hypothetical protein
MIFSPRRKWSRQSYQIPELQGQKFPHDRERLQVVNNLSKPWSGIYISDETEDEYAEKASSCDDVSKEYYLFIWRNMKTMAINKQNEPTTMYAAPMKSFFPPNMFDVERTSFFFPPKL